MPNNVLTIPPEIAQDPVEAEAVAKVLAAAIRWGTAAAAAEPDGWADDRDWALIDTVHDLTEHRAGRAPDPHAQRCMLCSCTEDRACPGGCGWAAPNLCTACVDGIVPQPFVEYGAHYCLDCGWVGQPGDHQHDDEPADLMPVSVQVVPNTTAT